MSDKPPIPPASLSTEVVDALDNLSLNSPRGAVHYAEELAEHKEREARHEERPPEGELEERSNDLLDGVPTKATVMIREINDKRYYYW